MGAVTTTAGTRRWVVLAIGLVGLITGYASQYGLASSWQPWGCWPWPARVAFASVVVFALAAAVAIPATGEGRIGGAEA